MDTMLTKLAEQSPGLAIALTLVVIFMKYIEKKDIAIDTVFNRVEALHKETLLQIKENSSAMGTMTEAVRKCEKETVTEGALRK